MISHEEVEELLPCPIKIEICCDPYDFKISVQDSFKDLLIKHNKNYDTKIEHIVRHYNQEDENEEFPILEYNECRIFVGKEIVQCIKCPDIKTSELSLSIPQSISDYYKSIVPITEQILNIWHDRIIEIQEENNINLEKYMLDEYDEILYAYYCIRSDSRAFMYLKKLATRYPNSRYKNILRRIYKNGLYGDKKNIALANKISKRQCHERRENF